MSTMLQKNILWEAICKSAKILAGMALTTFKSKSGVNLTGRVQPALQDETTSDNVTPSVEWICKPSQEQLSDVIPVTEKGSGKGHGLILTNLSEPVIPSP